MEKTDNIQISMDNTIKLINNIQTFIDDVMKLIICPLNNTIISDPIYVENIELGYSTFERAIIEKKMFNELKIKKNAFLCVENKLLKNIIEELTNNDKNSLVQNLDKLLRCPITHQLFVSPALFEDGFTFERYAILDWIHSYSNTNPLTKMRINNIKPYNNIIVRDITLLYKKYFNIQNEEFEFPIESIIRKLAHNDTLTINNLKELCDNFFTQKINLIKIFLDDKITAPIIKIIFKYDEDNNNNDVVNFIIDNAINLNYTNINGLHITHCVVAYSSRTIIEKLYNNSEVDKFIRYGTSMWLPIHIACYYRHYDIIQLFIEQYSHQLYEEILSFTDGNNCYHTQLSANNLILLNNNLILSEKLKLFMSPH